MKYITIVINQNDDLYKENPQVPPLKALYRGIKVLSIIHSSRNPSFIMLETWEQRGKNMKKLVLLSFLFLSIVSNNVEAKKLTPLKDFFKNPTKSSYDISPDGKHFAYLAPYKKRMNIFVDGKRLTSITDRDVSGMFWKGNDYVLYGRDFNGDENYQIFSVNLKTGKTKALTPFKGVKSAVLDDLADIKDDEILFVMNKDNPELFDVYRLNIVTGEINLEVKNFGNVTDWLTDHNGVVRMAMCSDGVNTKIYSRPDSKSDFKKIMELDFKNSFEPLFFTFDNKNIYAATNVDRDKSVIVEYDPESRSEVNTIYQNNDVDVTNLYYSKKRKVLLSATYYTDRLKRVFLDKEIEDIYKKIEAKLPKDVEVALTSSNKEEDKLIVRTYSDKTLGSYYFYDVKKDSIKKLADVSPWLKAAEMCDMIPIQYKSRDGLTIHGYLTIPKVAKAKNLPVVINPHGGPWMRDHWGFDPEVQFLANRGYAVLQMNYRGSTGYGKKFWQASFKQWGLKMQDDISDGVKWLIEQGIADTKHVAIYGGSYGGYAVLAGLTFTPDLYACGVDYVGVSNLFTFMNTIPPYWKPFIEMNYEMVGDPEKDKELLANASPVMHVDKIKAPLFIAQGAKDPRVNIDESNQMVDALKKRGINVPYMVKANEGHGFRNEENRMDFYREMEKFLGTCLNKK